MEQIPLPEAIQDEFATVRETAGRMYLENRIQNLISKSKG